jgi:hypothetical protein
MINRALCTRSYYGWKLNIIDRVEVSLNRKTLCNINIDRFDSFSPIDFHLTQTHPAPYRRRHIPIHIHAKSNILSIEINDKVKPQTDIFW